MSSGKRSVLNTILYFKILGSALGNQILFFYNTCNNFLALFKAELAWLLLVYSYYTSEHLVLNFEYNTFSKSHKITPMFFVSFTYLGATLKAFLSHTNTQLLQMFHNSSSTGTLKSLSHILLFVGG